MDNQSNQLQTLLTSASSVAVAVGRNPKMDEMASALSFYLFLKSQGKKISVVSPSEVLVELSSLVGIDYPYATVSLSL